MGIWDFFTPDAGQKRRQWLNQNMNAPVDEAMRYYLGAGNSVPQIAGLLAEGSPVASIDRAGTSFQDIYAPDRTGWQRTAAVGNTLSDMTGAGLGLLGAPAASKVGADLLTDVATRVSKNAKKAGNNVAERLNQRGPMPVLGSNGGNMFDPTYTGWTFKDVDGNIPLSKTENKMLSEGAKMPSEEVIPIRSMYAMQDRVNPNFAITETSAGNLPNAVRKNGKIYLQDGHHRVTKVSEEGGQNVRVNLYDFDNVDKSTPLLDYRPEKAARDKSEIDSLLADLFPDDPLYANPLPAARTDAEAMAKQILELRAAGRSNEVTEAMMAAADNPYMYANTPLDMSQEARMARASDMGYDMTPMYRGAPNDEISFNPEKYKPTRPYIYSSDNPYIASSYAKNANRAALENSEMTNSPVVAPLLTKRRGILDVDVGGSQYGQIPFDEPITPNGQTLRQVLGDDAHSFNINGAATTNTDLVPYWAIGDNNFNSVEFKNIQDRGNEAYYNYNTKDIFLKNGEVYKSVSGTPDTEFMANMKAPSTVRVNRPEDVRSQFARFDPEFRHLRNLTAAIPVGLLGLNEYKDRK